ncbi:hypothetical protein FC831_13925 [Clostridium botulinum]|nr:hypothetical protein [Clostridium botulinum]
MKANDLKNKLNISDIKNIVKSLGGIIYYEDDEKIIYNTICHGGNSPNKLYYLKEDDYFYCMTECGAMDIIGLIKHVKCYDSGYDAISYACTISGISDMQYGFTILNENNNNVEDWDFVNVFNNKINSLHKNDELKIINKNKLNMFQNIYRSEWIDENISIETMKKYNILYSTLNQSIIIPHFNIHGELIGIRQRSLLQFHIDIFGKYTPVFIGNEMFNHKLKLNLYGIHVNKETIKRKRKVMLVESEKSVLQCEDMFGNNNFTLAKSGSSKLSMYQINLLLSLNVNEIILAFDKQYNNVDDDEYKLWKKHIKEKIINPLLPYFNVSVLWDTENLLDYKDSPTDKGKDILLKLMKNKIHING